jgi:hypothetical protein
MLGKDVDHIINGGSGTKGCSTAMVQIQRDKTSEMLLGQGDDDRIGRVSIGKVLHLLGIPCL